MTCDCGCGQTGVRLLSCGRCHEENGEEVHPHPECPLGESLETALIVHQIYESEA